MKPLKTEIQDAETLRDLGSASVQIVHDLKNQLNGLKLYATFLRKRMEKAERPADEQETIAKLIAGLERGANDMNAARPLRAPHRAAPADRARSRAAGRGLGRRRARRSRSGGAYEGDFDPALLAEALKNITAGARVEGAGNGDEGGAESGSRVSGDGRRASRGRVARRPSGDADGDPFRSFTAGAGLAARARGANHTRTRGRNFERGRPHKRAAPFAGKLIQERLNYERWTMN